MARYVLNTDTDAQWNEVCDTKKPHASSAKGEPIARALPDMARRICRLLNAEKSNASRAAFAAIGRRACKGGNQSRRGEINTDLAGFLALFLIAVLGVMLVAGARGCAACSAPTYSEGQRTGVVTKVSRSGLMFKSWEGQLNLGGASADSNGTMVPNVWPFTVQSDAVAHEIESAARDAKRVTVHYRQHLITPINADTKYIVDSIEVSP
jgi:hypothetical protein